MKEIDEALVEQLYAQKERKIGGAHKLYLSERQKKILLDLWEKCRHRDVARAIGVSQDVARRWYEELKGELP